MSMIADDYVAALRRVLSVMRPILLSAAATAIAVGSWSSASASSCSLTDCMLVVTDLGTVVAGQDGLGVFGTAGADLTGDSYEAVFTYDLSLWEELFTSPTTNYTVGGQVFTTSPGYVSEVVTINGVSAPSFGASAGEILGTNDGTGSYSAQYHYAASATSSTLYDSADYYFAPNDSIPLDYTQPATYTSADYSMYAYFDAVSDAAGSVNFTSALVELSSVTISDLPSPTSATELSTLAMSDLPSPSSTPEPSTWAMLLVGFAGLGFAACRRSRKSAPLTTR